VKPSAIPRLHHLKRTRGCWDIWVRVSPQVPARICSSTRKAYRYVDAREHVLAAVTNRSWCFGRRGWQTSTAADWPPPPNRAGLGPPNFNVWAADDSNELLRQANVLLIAFRTRSPITLASSVRPSLSHISHPSRQSLPCTHKTAQQALSTSSSSRANTAPPSPLQIASKITTASALLWDPKYTSRHVFATSPCPALSVWKILCAADSH
jgi:hypothetical protein